MPVFLGAIISVLNLKDTASGMDETYNWAAKVAVS
jgi:hypothetical protein